MQNKNIIDQTNKIIKSTKEYKIGKAIKDGYTGDAMKMIDRLDNPPVIDGRNKSIDLGDMPKDMNKELAKAAIYDIVEEICEKYKEGDLRSKTFRHNLGVAIFHRIKNVMFY